LGRVHRKRKELPFHILYHTGTRPLQLPDGTKRLHPAPSLTEQESGVPGLDFEPVLNINRARVSCDLKLTKKSKRGKQSHPTTQLHGIPIQKRFADKLSAIAGVGDCLAASSPQYFVNVE
jgi:hypothetical protein